MDNKDVMLSEFLKEMKIQTILLRQALDMFIQYKNLEYIRSREKNEN